MSDANVSPFRGAISFFFFSLSLSHHPPTSRRSVYPFGLASKHLESCLQPVSVHLSACWTSAYRCISPSICLPAPPARLLCSPRSLCVSDSSSLEISRLAGSPRPSVTPALTALLCPQSVVCCLVCPSLPCPTRPPAVKKNNNKKKQQPKTEKTNK